MNKEPSDVVLYTRKDCPLCETARQLLAQYGLTPRMVDIDECPELLDRYTDCVPVVMIDGKVRFRGRVNDVLLRRLLNRR